MHARLLVLVLVGCSATHAPQAIHAPVVQVTAQPAPKPVDGVAIIEKSSLGCSDIIAVRADGGASLLCRSGGYDACEIRELGPDGTVRAIGSRVPGKCQNWLPRDDGGGFLFTHGMDSKTQTITAIDQEGHAGAALVLTSHYEVSYVDARSGPDGALYVGLEFRDDLTYGSRKLGTASYYQAAVLRVPYTLDAVTWLRVFPAKQSGILAILPGTHGSVDALVNFDGTLRAAGKSLAGRIGRHKSGLARVALDDRGAAVSMEDWFDAAPGGSPFAHMIGDRVAVLGESELTLVAPDGTRERISLPGTSLRFPTHAGRTWTLSCVCRLAGHEVVGTRYAQEVGGAKRRIDLVGHVRGMSINSIAVVGERVVAILTTHDLVTGAPLSEITAILQLPEDASSIDFDRLTAIER